MDILMCLLSFLAVLCRNSLDLQRHIYKFFFFFCPTKYDSHSMQNLKAFFLAGSFVAPLPYSSWWVRWGQWGCGQGCSCKGAIDKQIKLCCYFLDLKTWTLFIWPESTLAGKGDEVAGSPDRASGTSSMVLSDEPVGRPPLCMARLWMCNAPVRRSDG